MRSFTIIVMDTMRLDEFNSIESSLHGFEKLGAKFIENCIAPSAWTLPSHASLFTGLYPGEHGSHETKYVKSFDINEIKLKKKTFVSDLNRMGFDTYAISANPYVHPIYGFNEFKHFHEESYYTDVYGSTLEVSKKLKRFVEEHKADRSAVGYRSFMDSISDGLRVLKAASNDPPLLMELIASGTVFSALSLLKKSKAKLQGWPLEKGGRYIASRVRSTEMRKPLFMFINLMEAHDPYIGKKGLDLTWSTSFMRKKINPELLELWKRKYSRASRMAYDYALRISKHLLDNYGDQTIIITSDHGQAFNEQGFIGHGTMLYDSIVRIPMAVIGAEEGGRKYNNGYASLVNVKRFLLSSIKGHTDLSLLYSNGVYSESFGIPANIRAVDGIDMRKINRYDRHAIRRFGRTE